MIHILFHHFIIYNMPWHVSVRIYLFYALPMAYFFHHKFSLTSYLCAINSPNNTDLMWILYYILFTEINGILSRRKLLIEASRINGSAACDWCTTTKLPNCVNALRDYGACFHSHARMQSDPIYLCICTIRIESP